jgi:multiple sugar transport system permease protein
MASSSRRSGPARRSGPGRRIVLVGGLAVFAIWTIVPIAWIVETSLKPNKDLYGEPAIVPKTVTFEHYVELFADTDFLTYFGNSLLVSVGTTALSMIIGVLAAYAVTRLRFRGRRLMGNVTIVTYLIPPALLFIPLFQVAAQFRLTNSTLGLIPIYLIFSVPFCTWLSIAHLQAIPIELEEASLVDGCTRLQSLVRIVVPLLLPALAVIALYAFTQAWNEFLYALILISTGSRKTLPVGLADFVVGDVYNWGPLMAGSVIASLVPVLIYIAAQRWVVSGLTAGATKG